MPGHDLKLGKLIPKPASFTPSARIVRSPYLYTIDIQHKVVKRSALSWDAVVASSYFELAVAFQTSTATIARSRWRSPQLFRRLRVGLISTAVVALIGLVYPLIPGIKYDVQSHLNAFLQSSQAGAVGQQLTTPSPSVSPDNRLIIPKIGVTTTILEGPSLDILSHAEGVWHQTGILQTGNFVLAGHRWRFLPPNTSTFYNLDKLEVGDVIIIDWNAKRYVYVINQRQTVPNTDLAVLDQASGPKVTLYTCDDKRQTKRVVVTATLQP